MLIIILYFFFINTANACLNLYINNILSNYQDAFMILDYYYTHANLKIKINKKNFTE